MRKLLEKDAHGERPAVVFMAAAFVFGSIYCLPWFFHFMI